MKKHADKNANPEKEARPSLPFTPPVVVIATVVIFFMAQILAATLVASYGFARGWDADRIVDWLDSSLAAKFISYLLIAAVGIGLIRLVLKLTKTSWREIGVDRPQPKYALYALLAYGWYLPLYFLSTILVTLLIPAVDFEQRQQLSFDTATTGAGLLIVGFALIIVPAIYEELLCRGLLFSGLRKRYTLVASMLMTSFLFAMVHLQWSADAPLLWAAALDTFILSLILVYIRERTSSIWPAVGLHAIKNFVAFYLLFVLKTG